MARFRANPNKVRVSIRHKDGGWLAIISPRDRLCVTWAAWHVSPVRAMVKALRLAERANLDGIDLDMQWAYDHPMAIQ
jgi:hypothetical protein